MTMRYSKQIFKNVNEIFEKRRADAMSQYNSRRSEVNAKDKRFIEIERELSQIATELIGAIAAGQDGKTASERARDKSLSLQASRAGLLQSLGYPSDYLEMKRICPLCEDTGYIGTKMCSCYKSSLRDEAHKSFNLAIHMPNATFDTFDISLYSQIPQKGGNSSPRENAELVLKACRVFVRDFATSPDSILLTGPSGLGKTHLSSAVAHALIDLGYDIVYETAGVIFSLMENMRFGRASEEDEYRVNRVQECDLLIIDDLGSEFVTPFVRSALFSIINGRLMNNKKMMISTNLSQDDLAQMYDSRILSRIFGNFICLELYGKDVRRVLRGEKP